MDIKKSLLLLLTVVMVFSCKQEEILDQNTGAGDLTADISQYDNSNLGLYKGTFTSLDATERGKVEIKVLNNVPSRATLTLVSGAIYNLKSIAISPEEDVTNLRFTTVAETGLNASFEFSVNANGSSPRITNTTLGSRDSDILIFKETSRGPIALINGTWACDTDCLPGMAGGGTFNIAGTGGMLTPQITLNAAVYSGSATQGASTVQGDFESATITGSAQVPQSPGNPDTDINFTATHRWRTAAPDCSTLTGTWSYESPSQPGDPSSGTMVSDIAGPNCPTPGDTSDDPLVLPIVSAGNCIVDNTFVDLGTGAYTASGIASTCAVLANNDIFYTWTATTDALRVIAGTGSNSLTNPQVTIYNFPGGVLGAEIDCTQGSNLGAIIASGWSISDPLLVRLSASGNIGICFEEYSLPPASANDLCVDAIAINCGDTVMGSTVNDNDEHDPFRDAGNDVYYTFTEGMTQQTVTVSLCGSSFDTTLYVYSDGCAFSNLVMASDDSCGGQSEVTFSSMPLTAYTIVVDGSGSGASGSGANGTFSLSVTCAPVAVSTCGDSIIDDGGIGGAYSDDQLITYAIDSGDITMVPTLSFTEFDIESGWDYMRFYDGPDTSAAEITLSDLGVSVFAGQGFTGMELQGDAITATQQYMTVEFESDCCSFEYFEGYEALISCALPLIGGNGRQENTIVKNRKAFVRTEAQYADRRTRMKEKKLKTAEQK